MQFEINNIRFENAGFEIIPRAIAQELLCELDQATAEITMSAGDHRERLRSYGVRNLLSLSPPMRAFAANKTVMDIARRFVGGGARVVRAIFFDKTPAANWKVPWHQDLTIAVMDRKETTGYSAWTKKAGIWHVQPPVDVLESMVALRFHLDDADEKNGALKVISGSHRAGRLSAVEIKKARTANEPAFCRVKRGDCVVMRPLLLHSSSAGTLPRQRRVIHLEFAATPLPDPLQWHEA